METENFSITDWVTLAGEGKAKLKGLWW